MTVETRSFTRRAVLPEGFIRWGLRGATISGLALVSYGIKESWGGLKDYDKANVGVSRAKNQESLITSRLKQVEVDLVIARHPEEVAALTQRKAYLQYDQGVVKEEIKQEQQKAMPALDNSNQKMGVGVIEILVGVALAGRIRLLKNLFS